MTDFAAEFGVAMNVPEHLSNTRQALAMAEFARDQGKLPVFRDSATRGYWLEGMDLEDAGSLRHIAERAGLDPAAALAASDSASYLDRVLQARERGMEEMVSGVPTLFVSGRPIVGCQRYETFATVFQQAGIPRRT